MFCRFIKDSSGATAVEYGLIAAVVSLTVVIGMAVAFDAIDLLWSDNTSTINSKLVTD